MKIHIFSIPLLPPFYLVLCRITIGFVLSLLLAASFSWAGLNEGVQAYKKKDYLRALIEFRSLAEQGNTDALYNLGQMYRLGEGVQQNDAEAVKWYLLAAEKGDADAQYNLGQMYRQGIGVPQDNAEAVKWYLLAAKQSNVNAQAKLKAMNGKKNVPRNNADVVNRTNISTKKNDVQKRAKPEPEYSKGKDMPQDNVEAEAIKQIRLVAEQGNAKAQSNLGVVYATGQGVPQDYKEAVKWFRLAAEQGDADAQYNIGVAYQKGKGAPKDLKAALYWIEKAAIAGQPYAQANLGWGYMSNYLELAPDYRLAMEWNLKAAGQGAGEGSANIGLLYEKGWGGPVNYFEAANWYKKAIGQGVRSGQAELQLGGLYENGLGVLKDLRAAAILYRVVVEKYGNGKLADEAKTRLASMHNR